MTTTSKSITMVTSILLFLINLILWQVYDIIILRITLTTILIQILFLSIPGISIAAFVIFTKFTKSSLKKQGYKKPTAIKTSKCILLSLSFIATYLLIILSQSLFGDLGSLRIPTSPYSLLLRAAIAIVFSLASESIYRGYILRNLATNHGFFTSLYASSLLFSLHQISIEDIINITPDGIIIYIFTNIAPALVAGLFLGFFFYKIGWSLLGPVIFRMGFLLFFEPQPIMGASSPWWIALTFEVMAFSVLILIVDSVIREPRYRRRKYGLES